jgi:hypothetical protein
MVDLSDVINSVGKFISSFGESCLSAVPPNTVSLRSMILGRIGAGLGP